MSTILVVDNDQGVRVALRALLERAHHHVIEASGGDEALQKAAADHPDLMLLDLEMPGTDGWDVLKSLGHRAGMPIIVITAHQEQQDMVLGLRAGADDYITKPFRNAELLARVDARLRRPHADLAAESPEGDADDFTTREREVIRLMAQGATNADIAARLQLSTATVKFHITNIMRKLGVTNRTAAARAATQRGLVG
jgi:DNA-binding NarL/FixJ family response regulator